MPRSVKDKKRPKKVRFDSAVKGGSASVQITPADAPVRVAVSSLEAQVGYGSLLRQLHDAYIRRVAFFRSKEGGGLSYEEARAQACDYCENEIEAKEIFSELMSQPVADIRFIDLARIWGVGQNFADTLWELIKTEGREEFESGHLASNNLAPTQYLRTAWTVASYLGLRESFADEWQPQGGIQLSLIDMLAQSFLQYQHWVKQSVLRSQTKLRKSNQGYIQWQENLNPGAEIDSGYTDGHWDLPYVSEQMAIEHAVQMVDRWHRIYMRTLRNLRDLRRYSVTINNPQQVNIAADGGQQVNVSR